MAVPPSAPRNAPESHPQPRLAILAVQSFQASGALRGQGGGVRGSFAPRGSGGPRGTCSGHPRPWEQVPGEGVQPVALPRSTTIPVVLPPLPPGVAWQGSYLDAGGSGWSGGPWHPRGATHALAALQEAQEVMAAAGAVHPLATLQSMWPPAQGMSGATMQPRPRGTHPQHSPSRLRALVAQLDQPSPGSRGGPKEKRGAE